MQVFCPHLKGYKFISKTVPITAFFTVSVRIDNAELLEFKYVDCIKNAVKALPKEWKPYQQDFVYPQYCKQSKLKDELKVQFVLTPTISTDAKRFKQYAFNQQEHTELLYSYTDLQAASLLS